MKLTLLFVVALLVVCYATAERAEEQFEETERKCAQINEKCNKDEDCCKHPKPLYWNFCNNQLGKKYCKAALLNIRV